MDAHKIKMMEAELHFQRCLTALGIDLTEERKETPARYVRFLDAFLRPEDIKLTTFRLVGDSEMLHQRGIRVNSLCEHHTLPFIGRAIVAYIPTTRIIGLSKLSRIVGKFSSNLTTQETLTNQVADFLFESVPDLNPAGVGVAIEAMHSCMAIRGVKEPNSSTRTTALRGVMKTGESRQEFLQLCQTLTAF